MPGRYATCIFIAFIFAAGFPPMGMPRQISENVRVIEAPRKTYRPSDQITYKILVNTAGFHESFRLQPPVIDTENLELLGVSQESEADPAGKIFTFTFTPKAAGPAAIRRLELRWQSPDDTATNRGFIMEAPAVEMFISSPLLKFYHVWIFSAFLVILTAAGAAIFFHINRRKAYQRSQRLSVLSSEQRAQEALSGICRQIEREPVPLLLDKIQQAVDGYLDEKIGWNSKRNGYDTLKQKASALWTRADAHKLSESMRSLENYRFSGTSVRADDVKNLCAEISFLISKNTVVSPINTN